MAVITTLLLSLHLVWMLFASGLPIVWGVVQFFPALRGSGIASSCGRIVARKSAAAFGAAMCVGLLLGGLQQWGDLRDYAVVWQLWSPKILWAIAEIGFYGVSMGLWLWCWPIAPHRHWRNWVHAAWGCVCASNLLYHFPPLMAAISQIATAAEGDAKDVFAMIPQPLVTDPVLAARTAHFLFGSLIVAAVGLSSAAWKREEGEPALVALRQIAAGTGLAGGLLQVATGVWLLAVLPPYRQNLLTGQDVVATACMAAGVGGALLLLRQLLRLSEQSITKTDMVWTWFALAVTVIGMAGTEVRCYGPV